MNLINEPIEFRFLKKLKVGRKWSRENFIAHDHRLYYIVSGWAKLVFPSREIELKPKHLYLLPAHENMASYCPEKMEHYYLHFHLDQENSAFHRIINQGPYVHDLTHGHQLLTDCLDSALQSSEGLEKDLLIQAALRIGLSFFTTQFGSIGEIDPRIERSLKLIENQLYQDFLVSEIADTIGLDRVYFALLFRKDMGQSPKEYILKRRIEKAQSYLWDSPLKIKEIAYRCGFKDQYYFSRLFKKQCKYSPRQYRELSIHNKY